MIVSKTQITVNFIVAVVFALWMPWLPLALGVIGTLGMLLAVFAEGPRHSRELLLPLVVCMASTVVWFYGLEYPAVPIAAALVASIVDMLLRPRSIAPGIQA